MSFGILWPIDDTVYHPTFSLVLASESPRRRALLRDAGFDFDIVPANIDEQRQAKEPADQYVRRLAAAKAEAVLDGLDDETVIVIGADTVVVLDGEVLGKPPDAQAATEMLRRLSGRAHDVLTGVAVRCASGGRDIVERSRVTFVRLNEAMIAWYMARGESLDKAGGYGVQGGASRFVARIDGSYSNVVGLPMSRVDGLLADLGQELVSRGIIETGGDR